MADNIKSRSVSDFGDWTGGVNSAIPANAIPSSQIAWAENVTNRGNVLQTRPGLRIREMLDVSGSPLPDGNPQGFTFFQHTDLSIYALFAISGRVYYSKEPFMVYHRVPNVQFYDEAPIVTFKATKRGAKYEPGAGLQLIEPYNVLIMQDGMTRAAYWDGEKSGHLDPSPGVRQVPIGLWMEWVGSRLWVATGHRVYASDILDPLSFTEGDYLAERDGFWFPSPITGMIQNAQSEALLVFTANTTSSLQSNIRVRTQWQQTPDFQKEILPSIGCVSGKSIINYCGYTWWLSADGLTNLDAALNTYRTGRIIYRDEEMARAKGNLSPVLNRSCIGAFNNYLLLSVPHADVIWNRHTWAMDASVISLLSGGTEPCWSGAWTGIRPVEWATYEKNGSRRIFCLSNDYNYYQGSKVHVWEAFTGDREDNGNPVPCSIETRAVVIDGDYRQFKYAEIDVREVYDEVEVQVYFAGMKGPWFQILDTVIQAEHGSINSVIQSVIDDSSVIEAFNPQTRTLRTQEVSGGSYVSEGDVCGIESRFKGHIDKAFQIRVDWKGRMAISRIRIYTDSNGTGITGKCVTSESEDHNIINEQGEGIEWSPPEELE